MNKNNFTPTTIVTIIVTAVVALGIGYVLFRTAPQNVNQAGTGAVDTMHGGSAVAVNTAQLDSLVGKPVPTIQLTDKDGKTYTPADSKGKYTVLFFNEGLMCYPACWNQISAFGGDPRFNSDNIQAISVVVDSAAEWQKAIAKMPELAKATTMFDTGANVSRQLGMLTTASSMHKGSLPGHSYVVIDKEGIVRYVLDDPNMAIANDMLFGKIEALN
ncbi:MAG: redoxin domain-containing protein [Candidatus Paceibacterota bacterium]|jgi:peroxiredoxin|nr:peroxiredoxin family protein [Ignavibacteriaceae bacterium]